MTTEREQSTNIGLDGSQSEGSADLLTGHLADLHVLYIKTRKYHWNVTGRNFHSLHELFEQQYTLIAEEIDEVAERIRALGAPAVGTMSEFCQVARLSEQPRDYPDAMTMVANLLNDHEQVIRQLRQDVDTTAEQLHDQGTSDFLTGVMESHEKVAWMLRAFLDEE